MSAGPDAQQSATEGTPSTTPQAVKSATVSEAVITSSSSGPEPALSPVAEQDADPEEDDFHPGLRLWVIIIGLGVTLLLTALENTVVTVAMPMIVSDLGLRENYIWVTNAFFICRFVSPIPP